MEENLDLSKNEELSKALNEFEVESNEQQNVQQVEQHIDAFQSIKAPEIHEVPKMVQLVMHWFHLKKQKQAEYILLGLAGIMIAISLFLIFKGNPSTTPPPDYLVEQAGSPADLSP